MAGQSRSTEGAGESRLAEELPFRPLVKVWVERGGEVALSEWRIALLEAVEATGSLSSAARQLNVPYRTAWYKLRQIEPSAIPASRVLTVPSLYGRSQTYMK